MHHCELNISFRKYILTLVCLLCSRCSAKTEGSVCCQHPPRHCKHRKPQKETEQIFPKVSVKISALAGPFQMNFSVQLLSWVYGKKKKKKTMFVGSFFPVVLLELPLLTIVIQLPVSVGGLVKLGFRVLKSWLPCS